MYGINGSNYTFAAQKYQAWKITYYPDTEKWIIIKKYGSNYIYGDSQNAPTSLQYVVRNGNTAGR